MAVLGDGERRLFAAMEARDRRHALEVFGRVEATGETDPDLLAAALLHDCGKGAVPVWLRSLNVLGPAIVRACARDGSGWRAAAYRLVHHPQIGARLALAAGASPETAGYIAGRAAPENQNKIEVLRTADDAS